MLNLAIIILYRIIDFGTKGLKRFTDTNTIRILFRHLFNINHLDPAYDLAGEDNGQQGVHNFI